MPIWGSIERNTGSWTPYSTSENDVIEAQYQSGAMSVELPTCFNAVLHFNRSGGPNDHHYQMTPAVGDKPPGFRSVLRGEPGQSVRLNWWDDLRMWRLDAPEVPVQYQQDIQVDWPTGTVDDAGYVWQWCDLTGSAFANAVEMVRFTPSTRPYAYPGTPHPSARLLHRCLVVRRCSPLPCSVERPCWG